MAKTVYKNKYQGGSYMKLMFIGAAHEVTGSCHYLNACGKNILVDCGMEQGRDIYQNQELPISPAAVDYVLLTHAHIDHSGMIPKLYKNGFKGQVFTTKASYELADIMLRDSAHIQEFEAEWRNRKAKRSGQEVFEPAYTVEDAVGVLEHFVPIEYDQWIALTDGIRVRYTDVGHLLGSASIEVMIRENEVEKTIVFSGDIGNLDQPILKDPKYTKQADYVVMESTYGDRLHGEKPDYVAELAQILQETFDKGGNLVIPAFAVGRTQEMLYFIRKIKSEGLIKGHDGFEVYVDSPLAVEATTIFNRNIEGYYDEEAMALVRKGINPINFEGLKVSVTSEESKMINFGTKPKVIISAAGMCDAGRIRHHLKHNLWRKECTILFVGYQSNGTLGRLLIDGATTVKLFGETIEVNATIARMSGMSGHADKNGLLAWVNAFDPKPEKIFVVHGEDAVCDEFAQCLNTEYGQDAEAPFSGAEFDLAANCWTKAGIKVRLAEIKPAAKRANQVFARLLEAGKRLLKVIDHNEGGANKDLAKFADQINALCDKWER